MLDRLDDIDFNLKNHDFSDRLALSQLEDEKAMQPIFAAKLETAARGAYRISREEEVSDRKKPDIRLAAKGKELPKERLCMEIDCLRH
jgi:hypothetical protein